LFHTNSSTCNNEGEVFLGHVDVTTDGSGNATFSKTIASHIPVGDIVTATATDTTNLASTKGDTSEFSACYGVTSGPDLSITKAASSDGIGPHPLVVAGDPTGFNYTLTATNNGPIASPGFTVTDTL